MFLFYYDLCHVQVPYGGMMAHWNVCARVCVCTYICMYVHVCVCMCMNVWMYVCMYTSNTHSTHDKKSITGMLNFVK